MQLRERGGHETFTNAFPVGIPRTEDKQSQMYVSFFVPSNPWYVAHLKKLNTAAGLITRLRAIKAIFDGHKLLACYPSRRHGPSHYYGINVKVSV